MARCLALALISLLLPWGVDPSTTLPAVSEDPLVAVILDEQRGPIAQPVVYLMEGGQELEMVCPVIDSIVLEPHLDMPFDAPSGSFYVRSSTMALFNEMSQLELKHIRQNCHMHSVPARSCDMLYISGLNSFGSQQGSFSVHYRYQTNGMIAEFITQVLFGPQGIVLEERRAGTGPLTIPPDLTFIVRTPSATSRFTVCEVSSDGSLMASTVLKVLGPNPFRECRSPIADTSGSFSSLASYSVRLESEDTLLTTREIVVVNGSNCTGAVLKSATINVTGLPEEEGTTTEEIPLEETTSSAPNTEEMASVDSIQGGSSSETTGFSNGTPGFSNATPGGGSPNTLIILGSVFLVFLVVVVMVFFGVLGGCEIYKRRHKGKPSSSDVENQNNNQELERTPDPSVIDGSEVIHEKHTSASVPNKGVASAIQDSMVAVNRDTETSLPETPGSINHKTLMKDGNVSETESEDSGVALLTTLNRIDKNTEATRAIANFLAEKVTGQIADSDEV